MQNWKFVVKAVSMLFIVDHMSVWSCMPTTPTETVTVPDCSLSNVLNAENRNALDERGNLLCGGAIPSPLIAPNGNGAIGTITSPTTLTSGTSITCTCRQSNNFNRPITFLVAGANGVVGTAPNGVNGPAQFSLTCTSGVLSFQAINPTAFGRIGSSVSDVNHVQCSN